MTPETICPECSGAGFFGNNGPLAESTCGKCKGTGVLVDGSAYRHVPAIPRRPMNRAEESQWGEAFRWI